MSPWRASMGGMRTREALLSEAVMNCKGLPGAFIEFGVASGASLRTLVEAHRSWSKHPRKIYGVDSFEGLPEPFENAPVGCFAQDPPVVEGAEIIVGWFDDVLDDALAQRVGPVALAFLDADLYSSTLTALRWLSRLVRPGTLLVFDEYLGENESERRAHMDWLAENPSLTTIEILREPREPAGWGSTPEVRVVFEVVYKFDRSDYELP